MHTSIYTHTYGKLNCNFWQTRTRIYCNISFILPASASKFTNKYVYTNFLIEELYGCCCSAFRKFEANKRQVEVNFQSKRKTEKFVSMHSKKTMWKGMENVWVSVCVDIYSVVLVYHEEFDVNCICLCRCMWRWVYEYREKKQNKKWLLRALRTRSDGKIKRENDNFWSVVMLTSALRLSTLNRCDRIVIWKIRSANGYQRERQWRMVTGERNTLSFHAFETFYSLSPPVYSINTSFGS